MGYTKTAFSGFSWMTGLRGTIGVFTFVKVAILARFLGPKEFGIFGVASLLMAFLEIITETGINAFLVQIDDKIEKYLDTAFFVSIIRGIIVALFLVIFAYPISVFFNSPESVYVTYLSAIVAFLRGFINPMVIKFQKDLEFKKEFFYRSILFAVETFVTIYLAYALKTASAIVFGILTSVFFEVALSHIVIRPNPNIKFSSEQAREIIARGKWITVSGIFNYLFHHGDDIAVGRLLNTYFLGMYQVAYRVATIPITEGGEIINKVAFPLYVKIRGDKQRLKIAFLKIFLGMTVLVLPFSFILFVYTQELVLLVLGDKWIESVNVIKILVIFGSLRAISGTTATLFLAVKKQEYNTIVTLASLVGLVITILPFISKFGIVGAAYSALIGSLFSLPFMYYYFRRVFA